MPQPYDYSTVQVNPDNYFESVRQGRAEQAQQEAATRQSALQKYMPGALQGDAAARAQVMANADPEQQIALQNRFDNEGVQKIEQAMKMNSAINQLLSQVRDGDQQGFEAAKARAAQIGIPMDQMGHLTIADLPRLRAESGQTARELDIQYKQAQIAAQKANAAQSYAAADASKAAAANARRAGAVPKGVDPNTGVRTPPPGTEQLDYKELSRFGTEADAAAKIAATVQGVLPAIRKGWSGPDFGMRRTVAGALWAIPGGGPGQEIINTYDQIDQAAKISGIEALKGIGGSDTERELLTAIQTGVNPEQTQKENERRARGQIAAADILSKKAQLASEWVNRFGSLKYAAPDGTTWQKFWPAYQKQEWAAHRQREAQLEAEAKQTRGGGKSSSVLDAADAIVSMPRGRSDGR